MKRFIGFLVLLLALAVVRQAGAAERVQICTPAQMEHIDINDDHGVMCLDTARVLVDLVRESGYRCDTIVGLLLSPADKKYFVTCRIRASEYRNYASIGGAPFQPVP